MDAHGVDVVRANFDDLQAFVFDTFKDISSVRTQARLIAGIHSFYRFLLYHHYIEQDPSELLETPKKELHLPDKYVEKAVEKYDFSSFEWNENLMAAEAQPEQYKAND